MSAALQAALLQRPRPWRIVGDSVVEDANGQEVCTVDTQRNLDDDVCLALAQLIAEQEAPAATGAGECSGALALALEDLANASEVVRRMLHNSKGHQNRAFNEVGIPFVSAINRARLVLKDHDRLRAQPQAREEAQ